MEPPIKTGQDNPLKKANIFSKLTFWCFKPLIWKGYKQELSNDDVFKIDDIETMATASAALEREWWKEKDKIKNGNGDFRFALARAFGLRFALHSILVLFEKISRIIQTLLFIHIMSYFEMDSTMDETEAYLSAAGIALCSLFQAFIMPQIIHYFIRCTLQWQAATAGVLYKKALKFSAYGSPSTTSGHVIDLVGQDVQQLGEIVWVLNTVWLGIFHAVVILTILYYQIGASVFSCLAILLLTWPLQTVLANKAANYRQINYERQDERVTIISDMVSGMRVIKMYCWEKPFGKIVQKIRKLEMDAVWSSRKWLSVMREMYEFGGRMFTSVVIVVYVATNNEISAAKVFPLLALFSILSYQLMEELPWGWKFYKELGVSCKRIQDYLMAEEVKKICPNNKWKGLSMNGVSASWHKNDDDSEKKRLNTLDRVTFCVEEGELAAVAGAVGSGKSSLFMALLSELPVQSGSISVPKKMAYACQQPWIFSSTIRQNILFGNTLQQAKYDKILEVTTLDQDLLNFEHGDLTLVGEKGVTLSGGQKARMSLARALYSDADVYLLDDPLSAVDPAVGRHIFNKCIKEYLNGKTRVLITHQLQYLKEVDKICVMSDGKMEVMHGFESLKEQKREYFNQLSMEDKEGHKQDELDEKKGSDEEKAEILQDEEKEIGSVSLQCFKEYFSSGNSRPFMLLVVVFILITQACFNLSDWWLAEWTRLEEEKLWSNSTETGNDDETYTYMGIYVGITLGSFFVGLVRTFSFYKLTINSAVSLHHKMYSSVIRAPIRFYDRNPKGRIMNRFSSDMGTLSFALPENLMEFLKYFGNLVGNLILMTIINPYLAITLLPIGAALILVRTVFVRAQSRISRIGSAAFSPILTHLSASLEGIHTIRSSQNGDQLTEDFFGHYDFFTGTAFTSISMFSLFSYLIAVLAASFNVFVCIFCVALADFYSPGEVGVSMNYVLVMIWQIFDACRTSIDIEVGMVSTERVLRYTKLDPEAALQNDYKTKDNWPSSGALSLKNVSLSYKDNERVLKDVDFRIDSGQKVGIVGRTGAGKSSIIQALFRLTECEGEIIYDGIPIQQLGLHDVRSNVSIIPQDPSLFCGTVRSNLDPFEEYSDAILWNALKVVRLDSDIKKLPEGLEAPINEMGNNLSVGQRQLMCLARATLKKNPLIVLDEATANVDKETDEVIQQTIRNDFTSCTVLTIAHRLNTVIDLDKILVMDSGQLVEFDQPHKLLQNPNSVFSKMVAATGLREQERLHSIAKLSSEKDLISIADQSNISPDLKDGNDGVTQAQNGRINHAYEKEPEVTKL